MKNEKHLLLILDDNGSIVSTIEDLIKGLKNWEVLIAFSILECYDIIKNNREDIDYFLCDSNMDQTDLPDKLKSENTSSIYTGYLWFTNVILPEFPEFISKYSILSAYVEEIRLKYAAEPISMINKNSPDGGIRDILQELKQTSKREK